MTSAELRVEIEVLEAEVTHLRETLAKMPALIRKAARGTPEERNQAIIDGDLLAAMRFGLVDETSAPASGQGAAATCETCAQCGQGMTNGDAIDAGNGLVFCSGPCYGAMVGVPVSEPAPVVQQPTVTTAGARKETP